MARDRLTDQDRGPARRCGGDRAGVLLLAPGPGVPRDLVGVVPGWATAAEARVASGFHFALDPECRSSTPTFATARSGSGTKTTAASIRQTEMAVRAAIEVGAVSAPAPTGPVRGPFLPARDLTSLVRGAPAPESGAHGHIADGNGSQTCLE
jgi:hypothetical protein